MNTTYRLPNSPTLRKEHEAGLAEGKEEGREEGRAEGAIKERRASVFRTMRVRSLVPTGKQREMVEACEDLHVLERWAERAVTASSADDIFR